MDDFAVNSVKQDPVTGSVAVRRNTAPDALDAWGIMSPTTGGSYGPTAHVEDWVDLSTTPVA